MDTPAAGFIAVSIAVLSYGSNYALLKPFENGDGLYVQFMMGNGIFVVGFGLMAILNRFVFVWGGILGGALWASGNAMVPAIIQRIGMGLGLLLWSVGNLFIGWCVGHFGMFNTTPEHTHSLTMNIIGVVLAVFSLLGYFMVKPTVQEPPLETADSSPLLIGVNSAYGAENPRQWVVDRLVGRRVSGVVMAVLAGVLYGFCQVPFKIWYQTAHTKYVALDYTFSYFLGVFLASTFFFLIYAILLRNKPRVYSSVTFSAWLCGIAWGIASAAWIVANGTLGFTIGYPLVVVGPCLVVSMWSVFVFHEIRGKRNFVYLTIALLLNVACVLLIAFSY